MAPKTSRIQNAKTFLSVLNSDAIIFLCMRLSSIVLGIAAIFLLGRAATVQYYFYTDGLGHVYDLMPLGPLVFSLVWAIASLILPGCRKTYHPALDVGLDLIAWASNISVGAVLLNWAAEGYDTSFCREFQIEECRSLGAELTRTEHTGAIMAVAVGITHVVMFVRACRAVYIRKKQYVPSRNSFIVLEKGETRNPSDSSASSQRGLFSRGSNNTKQSSRGTGNQSEEQSEPQSPV